MSVDLIHTTLGVTFIAIWAVIGQFTIPKRR